VSPESDPSLRARANRSVPVARAFQWYGEALRLFKRRPLPFIGLALAVIAAELLLGVIPVVGRPLANIVVPILACGLLYASLAADRGERPRAAHLVTAFAAPVASLGAVILSSLAVFLAEWVIGWQFAGVNLLATDDSRALSGGEVLLVYAAGVAVSLPLTLVPIVALFEGAGVADSFAASIAAFRRNVGAFLLYGGLSLALLGLAIVTMGVILPVVLPLWAASSYVAWKDIVGATARAGSVTQ
jgi:uncharacterized membrane protein